MIISRRFEDLKKGLLNKGEYQIKLREFVQQNPQKIKEMEDVGLYFKDFVKEWIIYQVETEILAATRWTRC